MSHNLPCELKNWLFSLGFRPKNISSEQIEEEFRRLTPPEVRDVWRSILIHVVPIQESRYIKKVLLLKELEKYTSNNRSKPTIPRNLKSITELRHFKNYEKLLKQLNNRHSCIADVKARIEESKNKIAELGKKKEHLLKEKENINAILTLEKLKVKSYEKSINELNETHECLSCACSFWNSSDRKHFSNEQSLETVKRCLKKVNEFGKQRQHLDHTGLINEQDLLLNSIADLTANVPPSDVQKTLIFMLSDTLSSLLKMSGHVTTKQENDSRGDLGNKLTELEKQSVQTFIETRILQKRVKNLQEKVQAQQSQLFLLLEKNITDNTEKRDLEIWLETEFLKHRMTTRQNYLARKEEIVKSSGVQTCPNFENENEKQTFFKTIHEHQNHLEVLERDIRNNLAYLPDESIKLFLNYQNYCRNKITKFIENGNSSKHIDFAVKLTDSFRNEMVLLNALYLNSSSKDILVFKTHTPRVTIPQDNIVESTRKCNFLVYLNHACNEFFQKANPPCFTSDILDQKRIKIMNEENEFVIQLRKSLLEAKNNLDQVEEYAESCEKIMKLWNDFSINDLISKTMVVADHTFVEWQERYYTIIHRLIKK